MKHAFVLGLTAALVTTPGFSRAFAQAPAATIQLPPVTVTAQKEPADPRTLPVSVTAVPKSTLTNAGVGIVSEAGQYSPNTFFTEFAARKLSNARFRGIGSSPANPGVTTYFDGVPQLNANTSSIDLLDVEQVEFVRGPQSALFGRNTLGGLVNVVSSRPSLSSWTGSFSAPFANAGSMEIRAGAGGPVVSGRLGASFAMVYGQRDGYTTNVITGNDLDSREAFAAKGQLLWTPSSTLGNARHPERRARARRRLCLERSWRPAGPALHGRARLRRLHPSRPVRDHDPQPSRRRPLRG